MAQGNHRSCAFRDSRLGLSCLSDLRFIGGYSSLHNDMLVFKPLLNEFNGTAVTGPNNSGVNHHHLSARFLKFGCLNTAFMRSRRHGMCRVRTGGLGKYCVLLSRTSIANATGVVVTTILTGKAAAVCGTTYRPCVRRLYRLLGSVNTRVDNVTDGLLAVINIRGLRNTRRHVLPSVVRINSFVNVTTVYKTNVHVGSISIGSLNVVPSTFHQLNIGIGMRNSSLFVPRRGRCIVSSFVSNAVVALTSTP